MVKGVKSFNLRVYGLLINEGRVLITDEHRAGVLMTKFPGGGLEKGEGLAEGLAREFMEELDLEIVVNELFYVNEFLQLSAFDPSDQLLSFYYIVKTADFAKISTVSECPDLKPGEQVFRWIPLEALSADLFNFPIDKYVANQLKSIG